jgi:HicB family
MRPNRESGQTGQTGFSGVAARRSGTQWHQIGVVLVPYVCHNGAMDLTVFVDRVQHELAVAAEAGGPDAVALAERLTAPLSSAFQLVLLEALSSAADEITRDLAPGSVEVRLRGGEPSFAVTAPIVEAAAPPAPPAPAPTLGTAVAPSMAPSDLDDAASDSEGGTARINLRVPEAMKARIEEAAAAQGRSVNAWLTRAASAALRPPSQAATNEKTAGGRTMQHVTGWVS